MKKKLEILQGHADFAIDTRFGALYNMFTFNGGVIWCDLRDKWNTSNLLRRYVELISPVETWKF